MTGTLITNTSKANTDRDTAITVVLDGDFVVVVASIIKMKLNKC
jgi:hypothetical protein